MARSVFYYHIKRLKLKDKYAVEKETIKSIFHEHRGRYGYRRITAEMHTRGFIINHKTVAIRQSGSPLGYKIYLTMHTRFKGIYFCGVFDFYE